MDFPLVQAFRIYSICPEILVVAYILFTYQYLILDLFVNPIALEVQLRWYKLTVNLHTSREFTGHVQHVVLYYKWNLVLANT